MFIPSRIKVPGWSICGRAWPVNFFKNTCYVFNSKCKPNITTASLVHRRRQSFYIFLNLKLIHATCKCQSIRQTGKRKRKIVLNIQSLYRVRVVAPPSTQQSTHTWQCLRRTLASVACIDKWKRRWYTELIIYSGILNAEFVCERLWA